VSDVLCYDAYDGALFFLLSFGPGYGQDFGDLVVGHVGQTTQHVAKVSQRVQSPSAAAFDDGISGQTITPVVWNPLTLLLDPQDLLFPAFCSGSELATLLATG
jgi:hypothetical protein